MAEDAETRQARRQRILSHGKKRLQFVCGEEVEVQQLKDTNTPKTEQDTPPPPPTPTTPTTTTTTPTTTKRIPLLRLVVVVCVAVWGSWWPLQGVRTIATLFTTEIILVSVSWATRQSIKSPESSEESPRALVCVETGIDVVIGLLTCLGDVCVFFVVYILGSSLSGSFLS